MYINFSALNIVIENQGPTARCQLAQRLINISNAINQVATNLPTEWGRAYAGVQQLQYSASGLISDVTPPEAKSVPNQYIAEAINDIKVLQDDLQSLAQQFSVSPIELNLVQQFWEGVSQQSPEICFEVVSEGGGLKFRRVSDSALYDSLLGLAVGSVQTGVIINSGTIKIWKGTAIPGTVCNLPAQGISDTQLWQAFLLYDSNAYVIRAVVDTDTKHVSFTYEKVSEIASANSVGSYWYNLNSTTSSGLDIVNPGSNFAGFQNTLPDFSHVEISDSTSAITLLGLNDGIAKKLALETLN